MMSLPARVLVDLPNWLGDFVHALPALARLRDGNRGGETWALLPAAHAPLAALAGVRTIHRPAKATFPWAYRRLRGRFDLALTLRHSTRAKLLLAANGAARLLASAGRGAAVLGLVTFLVERSRHQRHDLDRALGLLGLPDVDDAPFVLELPPSLRHRGERQRSLLADRGPLVAVLPGSRSAAKRYPTEGFAAVACELASHGITMVVLVGRGEEGLAAALAARAPVRVAPTTWGLDETAALLAACDAAVGNDSGLTHLAALAGCPTVALFGPTDPTRTAPVGGACILRARQEGKGRLPAAIEPTAIGAELSRLVFFPPKERGLPAERLGGSGAR